MLKLRCACRVQLEAGPPPSGCARAELGSGPGTMPLTGAEFGQSRKILSQSQNVGSPAHFDAPAGGYFVLRSDRSLTGEFCAPTVTSGSPDEHSWCISSHPQLQKQTPPYYYPPLI